MKNIFGGIILTIFVSFFLGCTSDPPNPTPPNLVTSIKFTADGILYQWQGSLTENTLVGSVIKRWNPGYPNQSFILDASSFTVPYPGSGPKWFRIEIYDNVSLQVKQYPNSQGETELMPPDGFAKIFRTYLNPKDFFVQITKLENGYADGIFYGTLKRVTPPTTPTMVITNGEFKNVKVLY